MSDGTSIEWTSTIHSDGTVTPGATWNPIRGCSIVSEGCRNCYAMKQAHRFSGPGRAFEGLTVLGNHGPRWTGEARFVPEKLDQPLRWKAPRKIFVNSMSDLFHEDVTNEQIAAVFGVMAACPQHTFQVLTKRAKRMRDWFAWVDRQAGERHPASVPMHWAQRLLGDEGRPDYGVDVMVSWPLTNVHLGVSVEDQRRADERIPLLLQCPAAVRWVSAEPLLGPADLSRFMWPVCSAWTGGGNSPAQGVLNGGRPWKVRQRLVWAGSRFLDWVVVGGESGPGARPMHLEWASAIVTQCRDAEVPVFIKQLGSTHACEHSTKGGCLGCMPSDLQIRQWPKETA